MHAAIWTMSSDLSVGLATGEAPGPIMRIETPSPLGAVSMCRRQMAHADYAG